MKNDPGRAWPPNVPMFPFNHRTAGEEGRQGVGGVEDLDVTKVRDSPVDVSLKAAAIFLEVKSPSVSLLLSSVKRYP